MRITEYEIDKKTSDEIEQMTLKAGKFSDESVATDFSKDIFALFARDVSVVKGTFSIFKEVKDFFINWKIDDFQRGLSFNKELKSFMEEFAAGAYYKELKKMPPLLALAYFLELFKKPPSKETQQGDGDGEDGENNDQKGGGNKPKKKKKNSSEKKEKPQEFKNKNIPINISEAKKLNHKINKLNDAGVFDVKEIKNLLEKMGAGDEVADIMLNEASKEQIEALYRNITARNLKLFTLSRKLEILNNYKKGDFLHKSEYPEDDMTLSQLTSAEDLVNIIPEQQALDEDIFLIRFLQKDLIIKEHQRRKRRKQALYLLVDISGSMDGLPSLYASALSLSLIRQAVKAEAKYFLRFFDSGVSRLYTAINEEEALKVSELLLLQPYSGGGTNISYAIKTAIADMKKDPTKFDKMEILLISDGDDYVNLSKKELEGVTLNSVLIGGNESLKRISDSYEEVGAKDIQI